MGKLLRGLTATAWATIATLIVLLLVLSWCAGTADSRRVAKVEARASPAREVAADERQTDTQTIQTRQQERDHAAEIIPDSVPDDRELRRRCRQLRDSGRRLPACERFEDAGQAGPA